MSESGIKFVTRAADGNLNSVQKFIAEHRNDELEEIDDVNQGGIYEVEDCGIKQKWLLVHSDTAESRNVHSELNPLLKRNCSDCRRKSKNTANPVFPANLMLKRRLKDSAKTSATASL